MKALVLEDVKQYSVKEIEVPRPRSGEVLIRMEVAPINPSDIVSLKGQYGIKKAFPCTQGLEGAGVVVESGGGLLAWSLVGKRVACARGSGTYAQYLVTKATNCVKLPDHIPFELGACFFANPMTVMMFMDTLRQKKHRAAIQTGAASAVGKMMVRHCLHEGIPLINIVRREEQVASLREMGAEHVLNSSEETFAGQLKELAHSLNATAAFDCVSGDMTGRLINAMPAKSTVYVYGALEGKPAGAIDPSALIFRGCSIEGLWLSPYLQNIGVYGLWRMAGRVTTFLPTTLRTEVAREFPLEQFEEALEYYKANMSAGKVLIRMNTS